MWKIVPKKQNQSKHRVIIERYNYAVRIRISPDILTEYGISGKWCRLYSNSNRLMVQFLDNQADENCRHLNNGRISIAKWLINDFWQGEEHFKEVKWEIDKENLIIDLNSLKGDNNG